MLPNSPNVILAAERAAELSEKPARVVPTRAPQEGLAALLAFDPARRRRRERRAPSASAADGARDGRRRAGGARRRRRAASARATRSATRARSSSPGATRPTTLARDARAVAEGAELRHLHRGRRRAARPRRGRARACPDGVELELPRGRPARLVVAALRRVAGRVRRRAGDRSRVRCRPRFAGQPTSSTPRATLARRRCARCRARAGSAEPLELPGTAAQGARGARHRDRRRPARAPAARATATGATARRSPTLGVGEEATVAVTVRSVDRQADARPAPQARRGAGRRRDRADGGGLVQPAVARAPARRGRRACCCTASCSRRNEFWVTEHELLGGGEARRSTPSGLVPVYPATEGITPRGCASSCGTPTGRIRDVGRAAAGARCARPSGCPTGRPRSPPRTSPTARRTSATARAAARVRGAVPAPARARRAPARARARARGARAARGDRRAGRPLARVAAVRADRRPAARDAREIDADLGARAADAAAADGRGRRGQDRGGAARDAARGRERRARRR